MLQHEWAVQGEREARPDVQQKLVLDGLAPEQRDRGGEHRMAVRVEVERQRLAAAAVHERRPVVQRDGARGIIELQHELLDELAADDPVDIAAHPDGRSGSGSASVIGCANPSRPGSDHEAPFTRRPPVFPRPPRRR